MSKIHLHIVTPAGTYRDLDVDMLNITTTDGQIGILPHHIPLAAGVAISEMNYKLDGQYYKFAIAGGFLHVTPDNTVTVIGNAVESPEEIDLRRAEEAAQRAKERMKQKDIDFKRAEVALKKALVRIDVKNGL
ncbi:ATP synthase F1, epsilon subunit [Eggerthia catenaformis OT 569 = DSM 20559]|uniref:ATP synthase epsilon chain n=1 Tax=Eggerthia catenaformis OT 569 = DSM 20559 TaxID=999415 RepID=M2PQ15_9FIRM|nr:ATP synthase F1 subunit epsilon [Eggerthia catenaformis]EMD17674.1 ATP synthase F1, epsilon subunit [Eggerthia catenaformis OT 569 = DSM 20559]OUC50836.1 ATP synthase F1 subunit epsilon [Eggerthia catenaformis]